VNGWRTVRLADVAKVGAGNSAPQNKALFEGGSYPFFRTADVGRVRVGELDTAQDHLNEKGIKGLKLHRAGTVLIPKSGASTFLDHRVIMTVDGYVSSHLATLYANEDILDRGYLFWVMQTISARDVSTDTSYPTLSLGQINDIAIPLPPLEEQRWIATALDEASAAIANATANAEKNRANARELFELERDAIVSGSGPEWIETPLGEVCQTQYGISGSMNADGKGYKIFRMGEVQDGQMVDTGAMKYIDIPEQEFEPYRLRKGDVLFNRTNSIALVGKTGIFSLDGPYCFASYLIRVNFHPARMSSRFACHVMNSRSFLDRVRAKAAQSVNQANINATILRNECIRYPRSLAMQEALADKLDGLQQVSDELAGLYERKLTQLAALKQSLLRRAFAGELTTHKRTASAPANDNFATPEFAAQVLAFAHSRHVALARAANFGHVKAQKTLHAVEAIGGLELGRRPIRDAAGPNDFAHMRQAEDWARKQGFFEFVQRTNGGYDFRQLGNYDALLDEAMQRLEQAGATAKRAVELLVDMDSDFAEIVVTTHAAWNNLILDQATITDDAIVQAARDDWHRDKLRHDKSRFHDAIRFIRTNGIEPDGSAKRVGGQESLPL